ncbi:hypothetical protein P879_02979 [Paragonimus westermani]|uniref:Uncharacterized protein n=1 Tax=Paragonimus westermani TaxID=34504 RepID=A0A8T0DGI7_9TREM|nr:hypothetical protein P879_02979 [Paragonimus westermani]
MPRVEALPVTDVGRISLLATYKQMHLQLAQSSVPGSGVNAAQLLSGLSTSSALTNLARALLPTAPVGIPPSDQTGQTRLPIYPAQQPPMTQNLRLTSQGFSYVPTQTRFGGSTSVGEFDAFTLARMDAELIFPHVQ